MRSIPFIYRTAALFFAAFLLCSGCGRKAAAETEAESQLRAAESETYAETAAVRGVNEDGSGSGGQTQTETEDSPKTEPEPIIVRPSPDGFRSGAQFKSAPTGE